MGHHEAETPQWLATNSCDKKTARLLVAGTLAQTTLRAAQWITHPTQAPCEMPQLVPLRPAKLVDQPPGFVVGRTARAARRRSGPR